MTFVAGVGRRDSSRVVRCADMANYLEIKIEYWGRYIG
jgi:hypothetical protein